MPESTTSSFLLAELNRVLRRDLSDQTGRLDRARVSSFLDRFPEIPNLGASVYLPQRRVALSWHTPSTVQLYIETQWERQDEKVDIEIEEVGSRATAAE